MKVLTIFAFAYIRFERRFHSVRKGMYIAGGDTTTGDGTGGYSAFDERFFEDEGHMLDHSERGVLTMANCGKDRNASQFLVTLQPMSHLGTHIAP